MRELINMRKVRLSGRSHHLKWTHHLLVLLLVLWCSSAMGLARQRQRNQQRQSRKFSFNSTTSLSSSVIEADRRNSLRGRIYQSPQPLQGNVASSRRTQSSRNSHPAFLLSEGNPLQSFPRMSERNRGTSTNQPGYRLSSLDNTLSNELLDLHSFSTSPSRSIAENRKLPMSMQPEGSLKQRKKTYPPRPASINSILRLDPDNSIWDEQNAVCRTIPGLTKEQMELCLKNPEATKIALQGLSLATDECAYQMSHNRWNCSSLQGRMNPHSTIMFNKGYRESAFGHAISAAGVAYSVAKACSSGNLLSCGCGFQYDNQVNVIPTKEADYMDESTQTSLARWMSRRGENSLSSWKWSGCSHNMDYGIKFSKLFLDSREKDRGLQAKTNLHNNRVGRMAVANNMQIRCKCHGLSGSCELRTCWRAAPEFRRVGTVLKNKFQNAVMIDQSEMLGNRPLNRVQKMKKQRRRRRDRTKRNSGNIELWYYERSPTYCESNSDFSIPGTTGRVCNKTGGREMGSCSTLCCGRGYNTIRHVYTKRCECQFIWCCEVTCKNCTVDEYITVCK